MTPRQPVGTGCQPQRAHMGRHMRAIGQKRHRVVRKPADNLHAHEYGGNNRRPFGFGFGAGMSLAQEHMIAGPDAVIVRLFGNTAMTVMVVIVMPMTGMTVIMMMIMAMMIVAMGMTVRMPVQGVIVRHDASLARYRCKISKRAADFPAMPQANAPKSGSRIPAATRTPSSKKRGFRMARSNMAVT